MLVENNQKENPRGDYHQQWAHIDVNVLIRSTKDYIVCVDKKTSLDWETTSQYDLAAQKDYNEERNNETLKTAALLEAMSSASLEYETQIHFKRLIGDAIAFSLDRDYVNAKSMLIAAEIFVIDRRTEKSRFWYLSASMLTVIPFVLLGTVIWIDQAFFTSFIGTTGIWLILATVTGALGALLSVIQRSGKLKIDYSAERPLHYLEGSSRICAGALSGFVVALAVQYDVILSALTRDMSTKGGILLLAAFTAGVGERLVTSIISEINPSQIKKNSNRGKNKLE